MVEIREAAAGSGNGAVRTVDLVDGERVEQVFVPDRGLVYSLPLKGPLLVLTSQRVISFHQEDGSQETTLMPLMELKGVSVRKKGRSLKSLFQGLALMVLGVLAYFFVGLFVFTTGSVAIPALIGAAVVFGGALLMTRFFFWEREGTISFIAFRGETWELNFSYRGNKADEDSARLVNRFFTLKLGPDQEPYVADGADRRLP